MLLGLSSWPPLDLRQQMHKEGAKNPPKNQNKRHEPERLTPKQRGEVCAVVTTTSGYISASRKPAGASGILLWNFNNQTVNNYGSCIVLGRTSRSPLCLFICVWGWIFGWGGVSPRCTLWKQSHWDIQEHGGAFECVCVCKGVRCTELHGQSAPPPTPQPHPSQLQGSSLLADPHLLVVRSRLSLHVSVIVLETVVLQVWKAEQLRGEKVKVTTHSWGLRFVSCLHPPTHKWWYNGFLFWLLLLGATV